jgi:glycerol-3-phosphate dehydrogenase (NAD(P)+)
MEVVVLGAGSWGTALAILLARNGHQVVLLGRDDLERRSMLETRQNKRYLPGYDIPFQVAIEGLEHSGPAELLVVAVPSSSVAEAVSTTYIRPKTAVIASKGLEPASGRLLADVVADASPGVGIAVLSGPNLAIEIVRGIPTVAVSASADSGCADLVRDIFSCSSFRVSVSDDVVGVELAGALKNVLAIGAGMSDGLGFGDNTKGALLSRGLLEMSRLGLAMGAKMETFLGPAGVGDLFATAVSKLSRNYRVGRSIGEGRTVEEALAAVGQVAEGVPTASAVIGLAKDNQVDIPVFAAINAVLQRHIEPRTAVDLLMQRTASMSAFLDD